MIKGANKSNPKRSSASASPNPFLIVAAVAIAVVIGAVVAISIGDGDAGRSPSTTASTVPVPDSELDDRIPVLLRQEVRPVEIIGESLPDHVPTSTDTSIGMVPPVLVGEDGTGYVHTISPDIDGPVMLVFLAHWCPACNQELPILSSLGNQGLIGEDIKVYAVLTGLDPGRPNFPPIDWLLSANWPFDYVVDMPDMDRNGQWTAADAFGLSSFPMTVLINDGVVVDRWSGVSQPDELLNRISAVSP